MESMILYGSKEKKECKSNTEILQKQIEKCTIVEIPKYRHGELAIGNHRFVAGMKQDLQFQLEMKSIFII